MTGPVACMYVGVHWSHIESYQRSVNSVLTCCCGKFQYRSIELKYAGVTLDAGVEWEMCGCFNVQFWSNGSSSVSLGRTSKYIGALWHTHTYTCSCHTCTFTHTHTYLLLHQHNSAALTITMEHVRRQHAHTHTQKLYNWWHKPSRYSLFTS